MLNTKYVEFGGRLYVDVPRLSSNRLSDNKALDTVTMVTNGQISDSQQLVRVKFACTIKFIILVLFVHGVKSSMFGPLKYLLRLGV